MNKKKFKLKIQELPMKEEDREKILRGHKHVKELKLLTKNCKDKELKKIFTKEIASVREELFDSYSHKFYKVIVGLGPHKEIEIFSYYPSSDDIFQLKNTLVTKLSKNRKENKTLRKIYREFNGMGYEMVGGTSEESGYDEPPQMRTDRVGIAVPTFGRAVTATPLGTKKESKSKIMKGLEGGGRVFTETNSILNLFNSKEYKDRIYKAKRPYDKANYVGVELELICSVDRDRLNKLFVDNRLAGSVYVKNDNSIQRERDTEFIHEVTIIGKQNCINDIVTRVCKVLNNAEVKSYVNNSCGLHVHLDMRNRDPKICYENLFKVLPILAAIVPANRTKSDHGRRFCELNTKGTYEPMDTNRYRAINTYAYNTHRTLELRLHSGSTNAKKINYFINLLTAVVDKTQVVNGDQITTAEKYQEMFDINTELVEYVNKRMDKFKDETIDTKVDHFMEAI